MEHFCAHAQTFTERIRPYRTYHKFLESDGGITVRTAIDDIHHRNRHYICICSTDIAIEGNIKVCRRCFGYGKRNPQDCICTQIGFGLCAVQGQHGMVDTHLFKNRHANQFGSDDIINIVNGFQYSLATITFFITVTQF